MQDLEAIVIQARTHDLSKAQRHEAFGELVNRFQEMAYYSAGAVLGDFHLAQDAVQEAFVIAYQNLGQLREPKAFPVWLKRIVVTQCHRLTRNKRMPTRPIEATEELPALDMDPATAVEDFELKDKVLAAIQELPEKERIVTKLFYLNGYSQKEIARHLELPLTTVKKRLQYARRHLKGIMVAMFDTLYPPPPPPPPQPIPIPIRRRPSDLTQSRH